MRSRSLLVWVASSGCLLPNPGYGVDDAASTGASTGATNVSGDASTQPVTGGATSGAGTDGGSTSGGSTSGATGSSGATTTDDPSVGGTSTTGVAPGEYAIQSTVAACVLLPAGQAPFAGSAVCSANASQQNATALTGLLMVDTSVVNLDGMGRPAHSYLRFDVPAEFGGATIVSATLELQVADGQDDLPNGPQSGVLVLTDVFDAASLESAAPPPLQMLADDKGYVGIDEVITWSIIPALVQPGQPLLLGLLPTNDNGIFYRGPTNPGAPLLRLVLQ